ncbi:hypothetical protein N7G274_000591 [Stereocaulon virgatum]|uniref:Nuclear matrix protein n=1 Tax=Stereocaulon virgatum TaxID=373712 RepID=A0ABR4AVL2_9LECA
MSSVGIESVDHVTTVFKKLLTRARDIKPTGGIEPALTTQDFEGGIEEIRKHSRGSINLKYAAIETACRNIFYDLLASKSIGDPSFSEVWNLFDILSILSDLEYCEPSLLFWLVEELLDTQTIGGCRIVFDYLDSRRERITAKHFKQKNLVILRSCNELLRRLSRAEDTVFCGRVFIFLFQSFPLGDRSSVNLRGEYHVENITVYEDILPKVDMKVEDGVEVDQKEGNRETEMEIDEDQGKPILEQQKDVAEPMGALAKTVKFDAQNTKSEVRTPDMDTLYPIFWSLQESFSTPTQLFEESNLQKFRNGLDVTMRKFKEVHHDLMARGTTKLPDESKRGVKRKRNGQEDELSSSFNPKYLTSRDLFDLEISDLAFRRHILVQALILVDFLLSLTPKAKKKLEHISNKSVLYNYILSDEHTKWASNMRNDIAIYLQQGPEGKFYYRMVDTVLSRDKNWVHWKAEGCPPIERDSVSAEDFAEAETGARGACANKRLRPMPLGSLDLNFLSEGSDMNVMEKLKDPERYSVPTAESFRRPIADAEFDIDMARTDEEKQQAIDAKASKLWRTLRIASKSKLSLFDKIDDGNKLDALFEPEADEHKERAEVNGTDENQEQSVKEGTPLAMDQEDKPLIENGLERTQESGIK